MSEFNLKSKGDCKIWGDKLSRAVSREDYGGQILTGVIFPENPVTGYPGDLIQCGDMEYKPLGFYWCDSARELSRRMDEGYRWVLVNPEDPAKDEDSKGAKYQFALPEERTHLVRPTGRVGCELGELMWIPYEKWLAAEKRRNPSAYEDLDKIDRPVDAAIKRSGFDAMELRR